MTHKHYDCRGSKAKRIHRKSEINKVEYKIEKKIICIFA